MAPQIRNLPTTLNVAPAWVSSPGTSWRGSTSKADGASAHASQILSIADLSSPPHPYPAQQVRGGTAYRRDPGVSPIQGGPFGSSPILSRTLAPARGSVMPHKWRHRLGLASLIALPSLPRMAFRSRSPRCSIPTYRKRPTRQQ